MNKLGRKTKMLKAWIPDPFNKQKRISVEG